MRDEWSKRNLRLITCRDESESPAVFRRLMVIHPMAVVVDQCRKFVNGRPARLLVTPERQWMTTFVARASIAVASPAPRNPLNLRKHLR